MTVCSAKRSISHCSNNSTQLLRLRPRVIPLILGFDILNHDEKLTGLSAVTDALAKHLRPRSYKPPSRLITPIRQRFQSVEATGYRPMASTTLLVTKESANGAVEIRGQRFDFSKKNALYTISSVVSSDDGAGPGKASATYTWNTLSNEVASSVSNPEYADMLFIDPTKSDLENMTILAERLEELRANNNT